MLLAPDRFFRPDSGTETLLMQTTGIRDVVIGSGACAALLRGSDGEFRRWAAFGLISDSADLVLGLRSTRLVGTKSALIATLAPCRSLPRACAASSAALERAAGPSRRRAATRRSCRPRFRAGPDR